MTIDQSYEAKAALTDDGIGDGDLQPHPVSNLQTGVGQLHHLDDGRHVRLARRQR